MFNDEFLFFGVESKLIICNLNIEKREIDFISSIEINTVKEKIPNFINSFDVNQNMKVIFKNTDFFDKMKINNTDFFIDSCVKLKEFKIFYYG